MHNPDFDNQCQEDVYDILVKTGMTEILRIVPKEQYATNHAMLYDEPRVWKVDANSMRRLANIYRDERRLVHPDGNTYSGCDSWGQRFSAIYVTTMSEEEWCSRIEKSSGGMIEPLPRNLYIPRRSIAPLLFK